MPAFLELATELSAHDAPWPLVMAAIDAACDEVEHARVMATLTSRFGGALVAPEIEPREVRDLEAMALGNAVEGCVRETLGAEIARMQAARAEDPVVRRCLAAIARDEARHGELAWAVHGALRERLSATARRRIVESMDEAATALGANPQDESAGCALGLPSAEESVALAKTIRDRTLRAGS